MSSVIPTAFLRSIILSVDLFILFLKHFFLYLPHSTFPSSPQLQYISHSDYIPSSRDYPSGIPSQNSVLQSALFLPYDPRHIPSLSHSTNTILSCNHSSYCIPSFSHSFKQFLPLIIHHIGVPLVLLTTLPSSVVLPTGLRHSSVPQPCNPSKCPTYSYIKPSLPFHSTMLSFSINSNVVILSTEFLPSCSSLKVSYTAFFYWFLPVTLFGAFFFLHSSRYSPLPPALHHTTNPASSSSSTVVANHHQTITKEISLGFRVPQAWGWPTQPISQLV